MRIGFISGDLVEVDNNRAQVSVPDYPVQGYLMREWVRHGHEVVLLTRAPNGSDLPHKDIVYDPAGDPREHSLDVLFGDRLGHFGSEWDDTLVQLERYHGPVVYHQYIPYTGWAPPFQHAPHLLGVEREWMILNRADEPEKAYDAMTGFGEKIKKTGTVRFEKWEPFFMLDYPWCGSYTAAEDVQLRPYVQGYYGRLPKGEKRAKKVRYWMDDVSLWSKVAYGPSTSTRWLSEQTGCSDGGRVLHRELPEALESFNVTVQVAIDRFRNKGRLGYWPHRIVECALAGVLQLFDTEVGLKELQRWEVKSRAEMTEWVRATTADLELLRSEVAMQQEVILPRADPWKVYYSLEDLLEEHSGSFKSKASPTSVGTGEG